MLPFIRDVNVIIEDKGFLQNALGEDWWDNEHLRGYRDEYEGARWSLQQKREWSRMVEGWILRPYSVFGCGRQAKVLPWPANSPVKMEF